MTTKELAQKIQEDAQELKRLLGGHKHFWLPERNGEPYSVCAGCNDILPDEGFQVVNEYEWDDDAKCQKPVGWDVVAIED